MISDFRQVPLEAFASTDLAQPIGLFEDLGKHVLPLFLSAIELLSLARSNCAWEKLLKNHFTVLESWKKHSFLKYQIDPDKECCLNVVESLFMDTFEKTKPLAENLGYLQEFKTQSLERLPDFINDLNLVAFCTPFPNLNKPLKTQNKSLASYATQLRSWIKNTPALARLTSLTLRVGLTVLPEEIHFFTGLESLDLTNNRINTLPESIGKLTRLWALYLSKNTLRFLPDSLGNLSRLRSLQLQDNQLTALPDSIGQLILLTVLYLHNNQLRSVPNSIGNLTDLEWIVLNDNQLTDIPTSIQRLHQLRLLFLQNNQLRSLPDSIGNCSRLQSLYFANNPLIALPDSIQNLKNLSRHCLKELQTVTERLNSSQHKSKKRKISSPKNYESIKRVLK